MHARARTDGEPRLLTPEEATAIRQADQEGEPANPELALHWLDHINGILGETPELAHLPLVDADHHSSITSHMTYGICSDCAADAAGHLYQQRIKAAIAHAQLAGPAARANQYAREARARRLYQLGKLHLCRQHATSRIRAGQTSAATERDGAAPAADRMPTQPPTNLETWIDQAAHAGLTHRAVELHLTEWRIDPDQQIGLLERHSDRAAAHAILHAEHDAWITQQPRAEPGRCDRCRTSTGDQPRYQIAGRHLCWHCAATTRPRPHNPEEAAA